MTTKTSEFAERFGLRRLSEALSGGREAYVCDLRPFYGFPDGPDKVQKLLKALRAQFPYSTFRADVEREMQVFARQAGDSRCVDRIRAWCEGFTAAL